MTVMPNNDTTEQLIRRFVDDRESLSDDELAILASAVRESTSLAMQLRDQLVVDDALGQLLTVDRKNFRAQVEQRIADHLRGEDELDRQAGELHALALSRLENVADSPGISRSWIASLSLAAALLVAVGLGVFAWQRQQEQSLLAKVDSVQGNVILRRGGENDQYAQDAMPLKRGDRLIVEEDASISLKWDDNTLVRLEGNTMIDVPAKGVSGKRIYLDRGRLSAAVAKQPIGAPMIFDTPHAEAIVRGTELYLRVGESETQLEVAEGQVELVEHHAHSSALVSSSEAATATPGEPIATGTIQWPTSREGLVYLFAGSQRPALVRSGDVLIPTKIEPRDGAEFNAAGELETRNGYFVDDVAARDVASGLRQHSEFTMEMVLAVGGAVDEPRTVLKLSGESPLLDLVQHSGHKLAFSTGDSPRIDLADIPDAGKLTHVLIVRTSDKINIWIDGNEAAALDAKIDFGSALANRISVGTSDGPRWSGRVAGIAIYKRALSAKEITRAFATRTK